MPDRSLTCSRAGASPIPSQPAWFHRLDEILTTLRSIESTRLAVERLFGVHERCRLVDDLDLARHHRGLIVSRSRRSCRAGAAYRGSVLRHHAWVRRTAHRLLRRWFPRHGAGRASYGDEVRRCCHYVRERVSQCFHIVQCRLVVAIQRIEGIEPAVVGFGPRRFAEWVQDMPARKLDGS